MKSISLAGRLISSRLISEKATLTKAEALSCGRFYLMISISLCNVMTHGWQLLLAHEGHQMTDDGHRQSPAVGEWSQASAGYA